MQRFIIFISTLFLLTILASCDLVVELGTEQVTEQTVEQDVVTPIEELVDIEYFRPGALEHILEGEINRRGQAVGFHYDRLPSKKGEIVSGTKSAENEQGVYEAEITVEGTAKTSNRGMSTFFPDAWDSQEVVFAINEAYDTKQFISGNTYEGLTEEGIVIRMYLDDADKIISAFPIY